MKKIILLSLFLFLLSFPTLALQPIVDDALNYEKTVITADYALEMGIEQGAFGKHTIRIPKINLNTPTVQKINKEMYEIGGELYERLVKNQENNMIYDCDYIFKEENGVIGIIVTKYSGVQCGGAGSNYEAFYYDKHTDKQLEFKEYLSALGVNINDLKNHSIIKKEYKNAGQEGSIVVLDAILDSKSSVVYVETPMSMDANMMIESNTSLVSINVKDPYELYTGECNEIVMTIGSKTAYVGSVPVENDVEPIISNGRTMLPARFVAEKLGATVDWEASSRKVIIKKNLLTIELVVGSNKASINGKELLLDSPVFIQNGRTYTPVRFVAERLGAGVEWRSTTKQAVITPDVFEQFVSNDLIGVIEENLEKLDDENKNRTFTIENRFLVDLEGDFIPELCITTLPVSGAWVYDKYIFKYENGNISMSPDILRQGGVGSASWSEKIAIMDDGTARIVETYIGSHVNERYIGFWGGTSVECDSDAYESNLINDSECSFMEIWNYQKLKYKA